MSDHPRETHEINDLPDDQTMGAADWISRGIRASAREIESLQPRWDVPEKIAIIADLGHNLRKKEVIEEGIASIDAGASALHIHVLGEDGTETTDIDVWREVLDAIKAEHPDVVIDGGFRGDTFDEQMEFVREGLFDIVAFGRVSDPEYLERAFAVMDEHGAKPQIGVFNASFIQRRKALYVDSGLIDKPSLWSINPGNPYNGLPFSSPESMAYGLLFMTNEIKNADPDAVICCAASGTYSSYVPAQAAILGHHMRVGIGETRWRFPHRDEVLEENQTAIQDAVTIARGLGREPARPDEFREMLDL